MKRTICRSDSWDPNLCIPVHTWAHKCKHVPPSAVHCVSQSHQATHVEVCCSHNCTAASVRSLHSKLGTRHPSNLQERSLHVMLWHAATSREHATAGQQWHYNGADKFVGSSRKTQILATPRTQAVCVPLFNPTSSHSNLIIPSNPDIPCKRAGAVRCPDSTTALCSQQR